MKNTRLTLLRTFWIACMAILLNGCSKSDDAPTSDGSIDAIVGNYKGKIEVFGSNAEYFNSTLIITKVGDREIKVTAKSGENYSYITPKIFKVTNSSDIGILEVGPSGSITYMIKDKTISIITKTQAANDVIYSFEGTKQ